ncbi:MAG TPA: asparagine synthase C-terminal domain-containing protein [Flavobacterium sp.]|uniref:asparagine synthase-related protein n=1 Tax=unclassified Flavobacterium TaxID=196869 RepID=UPI0025B8880F|nr:MULTISPECIES: asparagine synthase C-terminal domain-containing protein [unclassified Flavobacterium]HRE79342.1 asparagine synthase C-terminal domain-containing protein [Flavobacterium sp.]
MEVRTDIIPSKPIFIGEKETIDYKAICVFAATGFFLDQDTYFSNQKVLKPSFNYKLQENKIVSEHQYFKWHYTPVDRPFEQIVNEFAALFEKIINEQVGDRKVILPLSGGLDSRTQAAALHYLKKDVQSYSYEFQNGLNETYFAQKIARACGFPFEKWIIPKGYLWNNIEKIAIINQCYTEFTHPRQLAVFDKFSKMGDVFCLGHWGDVLFDDMKVDDNLPFDSQVELMFKKVLKKGGFILGKKLWESWSIEGDFETYLRYRIKSLLQEINIPENANAQIRAFKSLYWAPRWTSVNLSIFESAKPVTLPYFDNRMCEFICSVPEKYLAGRQIQIAYLKMRNPSLAKIAWQDHRPFNLYNYHWNKSPWNLPYRLYKKIDKEIITKNKIVNNYENQFKGDENEKNLKFWLFNNPEFQSFINPVLVQEIFENFKGKEELKFSHPISTLLTLSLFSKKIMSK